MSCDWDPREVDMLTPEWIVRLLGDGRLKFENDETNAVSDHHPSDTATARLRPASKLSLAIERAITEALPRLSYRLLILRAISALSSCVWTGFDLRWMLQSW
jgi:hypothetical protein